MEAESLYGKTCSQTPAWTTALLESLGSWRFVSNWLGTHQQNSMDLFQHLGLEGIHPECQKSWLMWLCGHYVQENAHDQSKSPELEKDWYAYFKKSKEEDRENNRSVSLISVLVQTGNIYLGVYFQTHKGQEGNQKDSTQADHASSSWLLSVTKITCSWDEEREVDTIYLSLLHFLTFCLSHIQLRVEELRAKRTDS